MAHNIRELTIIYKKKESEGREEGEGERQERKMFMNIHSNSIY